MREPRHLLFLDFDGVLHSGGCKVESRFCRLPMLEDWLRRWVSVDVVISSSWKELHPFVDLVRLFSADLRHRVVGCTPDFDRMHPPIQESGSRFEPGRAPPRHKREAEIRRWLLDSGEPARPWAALDDMPELFGKPCRELVICEPTVGLAREQLDEVERRLLRGTI